MVCFFFTNFNVSVDQQDQNVRTSEDLGKYMAMVRHSNQ